MAEPEEKFLEALKDKQIPILTLDNKWHKLFGRSNATKEIRSLEKKLNNLLKRQGKLAYEIKELKRIKNSLLADIVSNMERIEMDTDASINKKLSDDKRLVNEVNEKLVRHEAELLKVPNEIEQVNLELMLKTMEYCRDKLAKNTVEIERIAEWISEMRVALKKNIIKKQDIEINNSEMYGYMHNLFGKNVRELFDMKYEPSLPSELMKWRKVTKEIKEK